MKQKAVSESQEKIFNILFKEDEITWQSVIYELIAKESMDPWDIDVSLLSQKFLDMLKKLKDMDFRISGKMVLAAAILLKIKSNKFIDEDIAAYDNLLAEPDESIDLLEDADQLPMLGIDKSQLPKLYPRTPQPRKRKVSVYDLINALEKALEVEGRRKPVIVSAQAMTIPEKSIDINQVIKTVYGKVQTYFAKKSTERLTFDQLCQSDRPLDKVMTFVPLLHLDNQRKVDLIQEEHFGEIEIQMVKAG